MTKTTSEMLQAAIGRQEVQHDTLDLRQARHMQVTLDAPPTFQSGDPLPAFWHYLYFNPQTRASELAEDGHEKRGRFIPETGLPRRMWAGGRVEIDHPLTLGSRVTKTSTITSVTEKQGRSGRLCFVTVRHDFSKDEHHCFSETQDIVYRGHPAPGAPQPAGKPAPDDADFSRTITPDEVMLFRYSALIFYGHRIHYDADYTRDVEGYPGLIVHGPLIATLLTGLGVENAPDRTLRAIDIRAMSPLFAPAPFTLEGKAEGTGIALWARTPDDTIAMTVNLEFAD